MIRRYSSAHCMVNSQCRHLSRRVAREEPVFAIGEARECRPPSLLHRAREDGALEGRTPRQRGPPGIPATQVLEGLTSRQHGPRPIATRKQLE